MANPDLRYATNAAGAFYVDQDCIACDTCVGIAPLHFELIENNVHAIVKHQPNTPSERRQCMDAMAACPVGAIGYETQ